MRIKVENPANHLSLIAELTEGDREVAGKATLSRQTVTFKLPDGHNVENAHPDLLALAGLITFYPWIGSELDLPFAVSVEFGEAVKAATKITLTNTSSAVSKRTLREDPRPGLAFSAGVDSIAALAIMPENTVPVFSLRAPSPEGAPLGLYRADAPLHAIKEMNASGVNAIVVESDLEWVRSPVGFTVDPSPAVPLILLADDFNIDAIGFGTIAEAAYGTGGGKFLDYPKRGVFTRWQTVLKSVGIDYYNCVAGLSELCTTAIARKSRFGHLAQSCVRGGVGAACMNCIKCFRKSLIEASMSGAWPEEADVSRMMANRAIRKYLSDAPIRLEVVLAAALSQYDGADPMLLALQKRVAAKVWDVSFTGGWYGPSMQAMVPDKYRESTIGAVLGYIPQMTPEQEAKFRNFDIAPVMEAKGGDVEEFLEALDLNAKQPVTQS